jgi:hypothetical protein
MSIKSFAIASSHGTYHCQGCTETDGHTSEVQKAPPSTRAPAQPTQLPATTTTGEKAVDDSKETFTVSTSTLPKAAPAPPPPVVHDEDDLSAPVKPGAQCLRNGCTVEFVSDDVNRVGYGEGTTCVYHPMPVRATKLLSVIRSLTRR